MLHLKKRLLLIAVALAGLSAAGALAQEAPPTPAAAELRPATTAAVSAENEQKLHQAFEHVYNLEFAPGLQLFEQVAQAEPESATVCAFWASALLYEILARQGTLQSQLFVTSNEFLRFQRLPPDPKLDERFHAAAEEGLRRAQRRLQKNPNDVDGLFAQALIYGDQANYLAGVRADYFAGLRMGEKAFDSVQLLRQLRPELHDVAVILGVHDYVLGSLPRMHRFFLFFMGARGSRERGLDSLHEAASYGEFLRTYAQVLLVVAWIREGQLQRAVSLAEDLRVRYPRNPVFTLELAKLYRQQARYPLAEQACRELLAELIAHPHNPRVIGPEDALLELGLVEAAQGQPERALESLRQVGEIPGANPRVWAQALLERGKLYDRLGQREQAMAEYDKVIRLAANAEYTRLAQTYRKQPYRPSSED